MTRDRGQFQDVEPQPGQQPDRSGARRRPVELALVPLRMVAMALAVGGERRARGRDGEGHAGRTAEKPPELRRVFNCMRSVSEMEAHERISQCKDVRP